MKKQINILPRTTRYFTKVDSLSTVGKALACVLTLLAEGLDPSGVADALEIHSSSKHLVLTTIRSIRCLFQKGRTTSGNLNEKLRNPVETLRGLHRDDPLATEHSTSVASPTTTPPMSALAPNSDSETETEDEEDDIVIHRFEHWMSVREKLEKMGMRVKDEASVGYIFIVGENGPKENGILDKDYFLTIDALKDYVKRTYGWYGTENGWYEPKKDDIVRLTREGRAYVQSKLAYELNDYFVICSYDSKNHTCTILPATKEGTFDRFDCRQHDPNIEGRDRWVCVSSCSQLEIDERYVYKILESKQVNDGWNVVDGALTSSGTKVRYKFCTLQYRPLLSSFHLIQIKVPLQLDLQFRSAQPRLKNGARKQPKFPSRSPPGGLALHQKIGSPMILLRVYLEFLSEEGRKLV